jgi:hypothetical protein
MSVVDHRDRHGEAVLEAHPQVDRRGRGERPAVFPLQATEFGKRLGKSGAGIGRGLLEVEGARAAMHPCGAYLLLSLLGTTNRQLLGGPEAVVLDPARGSLIKHGMLLPMYRMKPLE